MGESAQNKADWERLCMKNNKNSMCHICNIDDVRITLLLVPYSYSLRRRDKEQETELKSHSKHNFSILLL